MTGLTWLLNAFGARVLILPVFGVDLFADMILSFIVSGKLPRWLFPSHGV